MTIALARRLTEDGSPYLFGLFLVPLSCSAARSESAALPFLLFLLPLSGAFSVDDYGDDYG